LKLQIKASSQPLLARINDFFTSQKVQAYIVGGFVRDLLLARDTADIDIVFRADALEVGPRMAKVLHGKFIPLDKANRVGRVVLGNEEAGTSKLQIDLSTIGDSIEKDLDRRDFTIDAMAINLEAIATKPLPGFTELIDPHCGLKDIQKRTIRAVSQTVFKQDAARLLRAVRMATELGFTISDNTQKLIRQYCHLISGVAGERTREELLRLLAVADSGQFLLILDKLGLMEELVPELGQTRGVEQLREHHWDVFNHSIKSVGAVDFLLRRGSWSFTGKEVLYYVPWSPELADYFELGVSGGSNRRQLIKLAAILHDIAKPQTKVVTDKGRTRFLGHATQGASIAGEILERLRFSGKEIKLMTDIIRHHLRPVQTSQHDMPTQRAVYRYFRDTGDTAIDTLFFSLADHLATRGPNLDMDNWRYHTSLVGYLLAQHSVKEEVVSSAKLISGYDLMIHFSLGPGPKIGQLLEAVREAQASGEIATKNEALSHAGHLLNLRKDEINCAPPAQQI
jgi:poly(A) polymerase